MTLADILAAVERTIITDTLLTTGSVSAAARQLGTSTQTLTKKVQRLSKRPKTARVTVTVMD